MNIFPKVLGWLLFIAIIFSIIEILSGDSIFGGIVFMVGSIILYFIVIIITLSIGDTVGGLFKTRNSKMFLYGISKQSKETIESFLLANENPIHLVIGKIVIFCNKVIFVVIIDIIVVVLLSILLAKKEMYLKIIGIICLFILLVSNITFIVFNKKKID